MGSEGSLKTRLDVINSNPICSDRNERLKYFFHKRADQGQSLEGPDYRESAEIHVDEETNDRRSDEDEKFTSFIFSN